MTKLHTSIVRPWLLNSTLDDARKQHMAVRGPKVYKPAIGKNYADHDALGTEWCLKGDKDKTWTVKMTVKGFICDCPGMQYRGKCKHTEMIAEALEFLA